MTFVFVAAVIVGGPLAWFLWRSRMPRGSTHMVLIGAATGEAEVDTWIAALRSTGIPSHARNAGAFSYPPGLTAAYAYDVWVPARDETLAREVLGL